MPQPQGPLRSRKYEDGTEVVVKPARRRTPGTQEGPNYVMLDIYALAKAPDIFTRTEQKLLGLIVSEYRLGEPYCLLSQADIARRIGVSRQNCNRALKVLVDDGWVSRISDRCWTVSPFFGWRGSRPEWASARRAAVQPNWRGLDVDTEIVDPLIDALVDADPRTGEVK